jgi:hypothetical protein
LQQSPEKAHDSPLFLHVPIPWHRGTPTASSVQSLAAPSAPQQSFRALEMLHA